MKEFTNQKKQNNIYKNELNKACFPQDAPYATIRDLARRTISEKFLKLNQILKMMDIKEDWQVCYICFLKKKNMIKRGNDKE